MYLVPGANTTVGKKVTLVQALQQMKAQATASRRKTALKTLLKVIENVEKHPHSEKYRKIKQSNSVFQKKLLSVPAGRGCVLGIGFADFVDEQGVAYFLLLASKEAWEKVQMGKRVISFALYGKRASVPAASTPASAAPGGLFAGLGGGTNGPFPSGMPFLGGGGANDQAMRNAMQAAMSNPAAREQMIQAMSNPALVERSLSMMPPGVQVY